MRLRPCQPGGICRAPASPTGSRSPWRLPPYNAIALGGGLREPTSWPRLARPGAGPEKSGSRHKPPPARRNGQQCEKLQKVPCRGGGTRKDKLLESPNFLCELVMFHLAAGQPCFM